MIKGGKIMKKFAKLIMITTIPTILLVHLSGQDKASAIGKEEIIQKSWRALFGTIKRTDVKSIYVEGFFHGSKVPNRITVKFPNKFRNEVSSGILAFDGKKAAWIKRTPDKDGNPRSPEVLAPNHWPHFEVDIALIFPAFFDYDSEYRGIKTIDGKPFYEIFVTLPLGANLSYFVDTEDFLIRRRMVSWEGNPEEKLWENIMGEYIDYNGVKFPDGYSYMGKNGMEKGFYKNFRININPDDKLFTIPNELK